MSSMGLPETLKHKRKCLQEQLSSLGKQTVIPVKRQGPRCGNFNLYISLKFSICF